MIGLTHRQADALRFITGYIEAHGAAPTLDELVAGIGLAAKSRGHKLISGLQERGAINRIRDHKRAVTVLEPLPIPRSPTGEPLYFVRAPQ